MTISTKVARVLIVDDDPLARETLEALLRREGYNLLFAASGADAIENLGQLTPDIILMDVMMPGMNGFETCRRIKQMADFRHIPIILVTALDSTADFVQLKIIEPSTKSTAIEVDGVLFQRALENLMAHAIKSTPAQSTVELAFLDRSSAPELPDNVKLRIAVTNAAAHLREDDQERIFDKFAVLTMKEEGQPHVGLGLAYCRMVVEAHGGRISVSNVTPQGLQFAIDLP